MQVQHRRRPQLPGVQPREVRQSGQVARAWSDGGRVHRRACGVVPAGRAGVVALAGMHRRLRHHLEPRLGRRFWSCGRTRAAERPSERRLGAPRAVLLGLLPGQAVGRVRGRVPRAPSRPQGCRAEPVGATRRRGGGCLPSRGPAGRRTGASDRQDPAPPPAPPPAPMRHLASRRPAPPVLLPAACLARRVRRRSRCRCVTVVAVFRGVLVCRLAVVTGRMLWFAGGGDEMVQGIQRVGAQQERGVGLQLPQPLA